MVPFFVLVGWGDQAPDTPIDEKHCLSDFPDNPEVKIRKRYRKKKTKLEEAFPTYLQVWPKTEKCKISCHGLLIFYKNIFT